MSFEGTAARLVRIYKDQHETRLARIMAAAIATALDEAEGCVLPDGEPRFDPDAYPELKGKIEHAIWARK